MKTIAHGINGMEQIKENISNEDIDGMEIDFQYCDGHFINTHHFYFGSPLIRSNWLDQRSYDSIKDKRYTGDCYDLEEVISFIGTEKEIVIDLKNWIMAFPGFFINGNYAYLHDRDMLANLFWDIMIKYKDYSNILIQSYDCELIIKLIEIANKRNISHGFDFGILARNTDQGEDALFCCKENSISFLSIRYKALKNLGGSGKICREIQRPINIYGWFDLDDFLMPKSKRLELINKSKCNGYIKGI